MLPQRTAILAHLDGDQTIISSRDMKSIKRDIVLVPGRWCGSEKHWEPEIPFKYLRRFHEKSKRNVVCGSLRRSGQDFISVYLRNVRSESLESCVLIATFNNEPRLFRITTDHPFKLRYWTSSMELNPNIQRFDMNDLLMLLKRKYIEHPRLGEELWTMESECKQAQRRKVNDMLACIRKTCLYMFPFDRNPCEGIMNLFFCSGIVIVLYIAVQIIEAF